VNRTLETALGWRWSTWLLDYGPISLILLVGAVSIASGHLKTWSILLWLALAAEAALLVVRNRAPVAVLIAIMVIVVALGYGPVVALPTMLAVLTVALLRDRRTAIIAGGLAAVGLLAAEPVHGVTLTLAVVLSRLVVVGLAVAVGLYIRARADYVVGLRDRAARLEREHQLLALQAAGEERVRIARELHDVVAHNVSLMVVQAQALQATGSDPDQQAALGRLAAIGRDALSEMHRMLGVLRLEGDGAERAPQPGVVELPKLIARTSEAGVEPRFAVEGKRRVLPPAVDLSAYRIVQEALTNVIRHAHANHVDVTLAYLPHELLVTVIDDGYGPPPSETHGGQPPSEIHGGQPPSETNGGQPNEGHGLVGMRERVALFGGRLEAGAPADGRGYRVCASLPTR
jgi:signal transduction histidine kinase